MSVYKRVRFSLEGVTPIGFSAPFKTEKARDETHEVYEKRVWRERASANDKGECFIPQQAIKLSLVRTARFLGEKIAGKRGATYTKHFESGIFTEGNMALGVKRDDIAGTWLFVPSDGKKGGGSRVWKCFPTLPAGWKTEGSLILMDRILCDEPDKVREYLSHSGVFTGLCFWRPERGGEWGRYKVSKFDVSDYTP